MEIEEISIKDIKMADYNPRVMSTNELQKLENSINQFGLVDPIIINLDNNTIIGGHQRFKVLKRKNIEKLKLIKIGKIGWLFIDSDIEIKNDADEKALNIALNKISGDWDNKLLNELLEELEIKDFNISKIGFHLNEFDNDNVIEEDKYIIILSFDNEKELNYTYDFFTKKGYKCKKEIF